VTDLAINTGSVEGADAVIVDCVLFVLSNSPDKGNVGVDVVGVDIAASAAATTVVVAVVVSDVALRIDFRTDWGVDAIVCTLFV
jgi:hypothetical protein